MMETKRCECAVEPEWGMPCGTCGGIGPMRYTYVAAGAHHAATIRTWGVPRMSDADLSALCAKARAYAADGAPQPWCTACGIPRPVDAEGWEATYAVKLGDRLNFGRTIATAADVEPSRSLCPACFAALPDGERVHVNYRSGPRVDTLESLAAEWPRNDNSLIREAVEGWSSWMRGLIAGDSHMIRPREVQRIRLRDRGQVVSDDLVTRTEAWVAREKAKQTRGPAAIIGTFIDALADRGMTDRPTMTYAAIMRAEAKLRERNIPPAACGMYHVESVGSIARVEASPNGASRLVADMEHARESVRRHAEILGAEQYVIRPRVLAPVAVDADDCHALAEKAGEHMRRDRTLAESTGYVVSELLARAAPEETDDDWPVCGDCGAPVEVGGQTLDGIEREAIRKARAHETVIPHAEQVRSLVALLREAIARMGEAADEACTIESGVSAMACVARDRDHERRDNRLTTEAMDEV